MRGCDASIIASVTQEALLLEVDTSPKPGLVDLWSNGSHRDLNPWLFYQSALALAPYFRDFARLGASWEGKEPESLFRDVRDIGKEAEAAMFKATGGVNTHKGALFSLGILDTAWGYAQRQGIASAETVCMLASRIASKSLAEELCLLGRSSPRSHGERVLHRYGVRGIRAEVMGGFPSVRRYGLLPPVAIEGRMEEQSCPTVFIGGADGACGGLQPVASGGKGGVAVCPAGHAGPTSGTVPGGSVGRLGRALYLP